MMAYEPRAPYASQTPAFAAVTTASTSAPELGRHTLEHLLSLSQPQSGASLSDQKLALEMLALAAEDHTAAGRALIQRLNLVETMFAQLLAEPHLPTRCRSLLEPVRFAVLKNALLDVGVLTQPQHPLRQTLHNSVMAALTVCTKGDDELRQVELRMRDLPAFVDLSADFVTPGLAHLQPLSEAQALVIPQQLAAQAAERKQLLTEAITKNVSRELDTLTFGLKLPVGMQNFIRFGIHPLLCTLMLKHGLRSVRWTAALSRVQSLLASYEPSRAAHHSDRSMIISNLILDLSGIGMPRERIQRMISQLNTSTA